MSAFFCFTFPVGLGIYWIASAVVRSIQQLLINRHLNKMNIDDLVNENMRKMEAKRAKEGLPPQKITNQAHQSAKNINKVEKGMSGTDEANRAKKSRRSLQECNLMTKAGSITSQGKSCKKISKNVNKKK